MIISAMLCISAAIILLGAIGFHRFPDFYTRVHAATLIAVGGVCLALFSLAISAWIDARSVYSIKIIMIILIILLTNPTATHAIAKAAYDVKIKPKKLVKNDFG
jgi:multicomponent Na+:H+ antiporter subunit G